MSKREFEKLPPQMREALDYLWEHIPAVPLDEIPAALRAPLAMCRKRDRQWVRLIDIGGEAYYQLSAAGCTRLAEDRLWDEPRTEWSEPHTKTEWRKKLGGISESTLRRWVKAGRIVLDNPKGKIVRIRRDTLPAE